MRKNLKEIGTETRERYRATVGRCGLKYNNFKNAPERTMVLIDVTLINDENKLVTEHLWVTIGKTLSELDLKSGDVITFDARVGMYKKGHHLKKRDYKLTRMTKIEVQRIDRELSEDEITSGKPATFQEWNDFQEMKYLENEVETYDDPALSIYQYNLEDIKRFKELKELVNRRYFKTEVKTV